MYAVARTLFRQAVWCLLLNDPALVYNETASGKALIVRSGGGDQANAVGASFEQIRQTLLKSLPARVSSDEAASVEDQDADQRGWRGAIESSFGVVPRDPIRVRRARSGISPGSRLMNYRLSRILIAAITSFASGFSSAHFPSQTC